MRIAQFRDTSSPALLFERRGSVAPYDASAIRDIAFGRLKVSGFGLQDLEINNLQPITSPLDLFYKSIILLTGRPVKKEETV
jgi:hypothetical protein